MLKFGEVCGRDNQGQNKRSYTAEAVGTNLHLLAQTKDVVEE